MKVAEAGVILASSSNQTNFSRLTSEAGVALDQRLKFGHLAAFQATLFPISFPFILHSILGGPEPGCRFSCISCWQCPAPRPVKGVLAPSFHWGPCPAPSYRDNLDKKRKGKPTIPRRNLEFLPPSMLDASPPSLPPLPCHAQLLLVSVRAPDQRTKVSTAAWS